MRGNYLEAMTSPRTPFSDFSKLPRTLSWWWGKNFNHAVGHRCSLRPRISYRNATWSCLV